MWYWSTNYIIQPQSTTFTVSHNNIGCELFNILSNGLLNCTSLYFLNLSHHDIAAAGTKPLASLLQCHKELLRLDLSHNNFEMSDLVQGLQCLTGLKSLDLSHSNIGSDGAASLACAMRYLTKLSYLSLSHNNIGSDGMIALARGLSCLTKLNFLNVSHNSIDFEGTKAVITSLKGCYYLVRAIINIKDEYCYDSGIIVRHLISPDNTRAIAELKAAAESENRMTELDLGFKLIEIPPQRQC